MTTNYAQHVSTRHTPQTEPIPGTSQQQNNAGGFSFIIDDFSRLQRFLVLGTEGGTYYASERKLTKENATCVLRCAEQNAERTVQQIVNVSESGKAPKNDPAIFALALLASAEGETYRRARQLALDAMPQVCRIGTHLFHFAKMVNEMRGWGRGLRSAIATWYTGKDPRTIAYQCVKYQSRDGWSHRDLLRLSHPKVTGTTNDIIHWAVKGWPSVGELPHPDEALLPIWAFERAKIATTEGEIVRLIRDYRLVRECVPTQWLTSPAVWEALLEEMPLTAMVRNLATMTRVGLIAPLADATRKVCDRLTDAEWIKKARLHPLALLVALNTYRQGAGERGTNIWTPVQPIVDALDAAFYLAFDAVEPTNKRWLLALDVSGSMSGPVIAGMPGITPRIGSAAMALVTAATERDHHILGFSHYLVPVPITPRQRLDDAVNVVSRIPMGATDCALPMMHALQNRIPVDAFAIYTDSETWSGRTMHPVQALKEYRQKMGIPAKLIVVGMTATEFSIADPKDGNSMDVVGFSTDAPGLMADFVRGGF